MSANSPWTVKVLKLVEAEIEISAVTASEAMMEASRTPGIARVISARGKNDNMSYEND
jgi:hypothetical protein